MAFTTNPFWLANLIPQPIIFGRVASKPKHGGGNYTFAPLDLSLPDLYGKIDEQIKNNTIDDYLLDFTKSFGIIERMTNTCRSKEA